MKNWRADLAASLAWLDNLDVAKQYDVPLERGVPAIAVLESEGKLLFSQKRGEFEAASSMGLSQPVEAGSNQELSGCRLLRLSFSGGPRRGGQAS
jgi:hypothetical protein